MVSVIIPAYNCAKYLKRCVKSVLRQTYKNIECIIIDDGSTDCETPALCDLLADEDDRIVVVHQKNCGPMKTRSNGVEMCRGKYVMFVDADDYIETDIIAYCVSDMKKNNADIVCFDYVLNENKKGFSIQTLEMIDSKTALKYMLTLHCLDGNMWCKLYKHEVLENIYFDTRRSSDFIIIANILKKVQLVSIVPLIGYHYSVIQESYSKSNRCNPKEEEYEASALELYQAIQEKVPELEKEAQYYWLFSLLYVCIKMEKDSSIKRASLRFRAVKTKLRKHIKDYLLNPYNDIYGKMKYLLCYFNMFRLVFKISRRINCK